MVIGAMDVLALVLLLQAKHLFADFYLQNEFMLSGRNRYVHPGRALHVLIHLAGTALSLALLGIGGAFVAMILVAEFIVHYHIDWAKSAVGEHYGFKPDMPEYWHALGLDQTLHQITYLAIAAAWYFLG